MGTAGGRAEEKGEWKEDGEIKKREGDDMGYTCTMRWYGL